MSINSQRSEVALRHLKQLKPYDGWSLENYTNIEGQPKVMLKRRNVPLYKKGFDFIAYDDQDTKCVVGITSSIGDTNKTEFCRGIVLVDQKGVVVRDEKVIRVSLKKDAVGNETKKEQEYKEMMDSKVKNLNSARYAQQRQRQERSSQNASGSNRGDNNEPILPNLSDEQTSEAARLGLMVIGGMTLLKIVANMFFSIYFIVLPLLAFYAISECPSIDSFDAKKELKRVLRGHHLPDNHPNKPKEDWLSSTIARVTASVATEVATSFGYELSFFSCYGICHIVTVNVPVINQELYWIGIFGSWRYLFKRETEKAKQE